jgi:ParB family chromosome partitioning protein
LPALVVALAAGQHPRAFRQRVADVLFDFLDRFHVDERPLGDAVVEAAADFQLRDLVGELLRKSVIDAVLHEKAVRADAGLTGIAVFGSHRAFDGRIEVGVVEHDERRIAAEL